MRAEDGGNVIDVGTACLDLSFRKCRKSPTVPARDCGCNDTEGFSALFYLTRDEPSWKESTADPE